MKLPKCRHLFDTVIVLFGWTKHNGNNENDDYPPTGTHALYTCVHICTCTSTQEVYIPNIHVHISASLSYTQMSVSVTDMRTVQNLV